MKLPETHKSLADPLFSRAKQPTSLSTNGSPGVGLKRSERPLRRSQMMAAFSHLARCVSVVLGIEVYHFYGAWVHGLGGHEFSFTTAVASGLFSEAIK